MHENITEHGVCPLTGIKEQPVRKIKLGDYEIAYYKTSQLWTTVNIPDNTMLERAYQSFDAGQLARDNFGQYVDLSQDILKYQLHKCGIASGQFNNLTFLDYGCGGAHFVAAAKKLGMRAVGMELDEVSVTAAMSRGLEVEQGMLPRDSAKLSKHKFDVIMSSHVLEHVTNPRELILSLISLLKDDGVLLLSMPNQKSFPSMLKILLRLIGIKKNEYGFVQPPIHLHGFSVNSFYELTKHTPLKVIYIANYSPLDSKSFPTTSTYWRGLFAQKMVYLLGRLVGSGGYMTVAMKKVELTNNT